MARYVLTTRNNTYEMTWDDDGHREARKNGGIVSFPPMAFQLAKELHAAYVELAGLRPRPAPAASPKVSGADKLAGITIWNNEQLALTSRTSQGLPSDEGNDAVNKFYVRVADFEKAGLYFEVPPGKITIAYAYDHKGLDGDASRYMTADAWKEMQDGSDGEAPMTLEEIGASELPQGSEASEVLMQIISEERAGRVALKRRAAAGPEWRANAEAWSTQNVLIELIYETPDVPQGQDAQPASDEPAEVISMTPTAGEGDAAS